MSRPDISRKSPAISQSRWLAYATAGLASGIAGATTAEAEIHYSGHIHLRLTGHKFTSQAKVPLTGGASLHFFRGDSFGVEYDKMQLEGADSPFGHFRFSTNRYLAQNLPIGQNVSSGRFSTSSGEVALVAVSGFGNFVSRGVGFVGFKFDVGNGAQYGWVRIKTIEGGSDNKIVVEDYAWADPGEPILTGQKSEQAASDQAVPASGSLGALALGSAGLLAWRKRRARG